MIFAYDVMGLDFLTQEMPPNSTVLGSRLYPQNLALRNSYFQSKEIKNFLFTGLFSWERLLPNLSLFC